MKEMERKRGSNVPSFPIQLKNNHGKNNFQTKQVELCLFSPNVELAHHDNFLLLQNQDFSLILGPIRGQYINSLQNNSEISFFPRTET